MAHPDRLMRVTVNEPNQRPVPEWTPAPVHLLTLIEIHAFPEGPRSAQAWHELYEQGLCENQVLTERGKKWLEMLLETPLPMQKWVDPRKEARIVPPVLD